jgi:hypothetical protein
LLIWYLNWYLNPIKRLIYSYFLNTLKPFLHTPTFLWYIVTCNIHTFIKRTPIVMLMNACSPHHMSCLLTIFYSSLNAHGPYSARAQYIGKRTIFLVNTSSVSDNTTNCYLKLKIFVLSLNYFLTQLQNIQNFSIYSSL